MQNPSLEHRFCPFQVKISLSKKTPLIFGQELAKIQLTQVFDYSFGDFVSPVCQYLHLLASGVFFDGVPEFLHKNWICVENRQFHCLKVYIPPHILLSIVHMCILSREIDKK